MKIKNYLIILALSSSAMAAQAQGEQVVVHNQTPGRLSRQLGSDAYEITSLKVTGDINGADLMFLRKMTGYMPDIIPPDYWKAPALEGNEPIKRALSHDPSEYMCAVLDVSEAHLLADDTPFFIDEYQGYTYYIEYDGEAPAFMFDRCYNLISLALPKEIEFLPRYSVARCPELMDVVFGDNIKEIQDYAMTENASLISLKVPDGVTKIGVEAISRCSNLEELYLPDSITEFGGFAFCNNTSLEKVHIGKGLKQLGYAMFKWCDGLEEVDLSETNLQILPAFAFAECRSLSSVKLPSSLQSMGINCFSGCVELASVEIRDGLSWIGDNAFEKCGLESVVIPNSVTHLGYYAFAENKSLQEVTIGSGISAVPEGCFTECTALKSIKLPDNIKEIEDYAFHRCYDLTDIDFGSGVNTIDSYAFSFCTSLEEVSFPANVKSMRERVFADCTSLKRVNYTPNVMTSIPTEAFIRCTALETVELPEGLVEIGNFAYRNCSGLKKIVLPSTLKLLGDNLCYEAAPEEIWSYAVVPPHGNYESSEPWVDSYGIAQVYCPSESLNAYKNNGCWKKLYKSHPFIGIDPSGVEMQLENEANVSGVFDINGKELRGTQKGVNIIRYSDGSSKKVIVE